MKIDHPPLYKKGLIHLLNIIRVATVQDEITIITNLYNDDPAFAYFITNRLFLFNMIPLMQDRDLQRILNRIDDSLIALSLINEDRDLMLKVLKNISKRRSSIVKSEMIRKTNRKISNEAKSEIHKLIKSFFEEHYGRLLRIPYRDKQVYTEKSFEPSQGDFFIKYLQNHNGEYVITFDDQTFFTMKSNYSDTCLEFDSESYKDSIFSITGISEGTIYLKSEMGIRYVLIHIYYWINNLEDTEFLENISRHMIIPLNYISSGLILTIGAINSKGTPCEQVLRLKIR